MSVSPTEATVTSHSLAQSAQSMSSTATNFDFESFLICPISLTIMEDPVILHPSGISYDRYHICQSLLNLPNLDPSTGRRYDHPLSYVTNYALRRFIQSQGCFNAYDDSNFQMAYDEVWRTHMQQEKEAIYNRIDCLLYGMDESTIDAAAALQMTRTAASGSDPVLLAIQGRILSERYSGVETNASVASELYRQAIGAGLEAMAHDGRCYAQFNLGWLYQLGYIGENGPDYIMAQEWYEKAATQRYAPAEYSLGWLYESGQIGSDVTAYSKAEEWYKKAAGQGHAAAECNLGWLYVDGHIGENGPDYARAKEWCTRAATQGHAVAQYGLALLHLSGRATACPEYSAAWEWLEKAAAQGIPHAQFGLGVLYEDGDIVENDGPDYVKAREWYEMAANQDYAPAQYNIGVLYHLGRISSNGPDYTKARKWYEKAMNQGHVSAHCNLGVLYETGQTGENGPDYRMARKCYRKAAAQGDVEAQLKLKRLGMRGLLGPGVRRGKK